jgi:sugar/nucleoside kinase (ribokinase family)
MLAFDVICAGDLLWRSARLHGERIVAQPARAALADVAARLAREGLRVGVATTLDDDRRGRSLRADLAKAGVDVGGVAFAPPASGLVVVDAVGGEVDILAESGSPREVDVPSGWSSQVLLLCGLSPITSKAAALCRAARRARRDGTVVVLDASGSMKQWAGRDPRMLAMLIREAHVVRCSVLDLAILGIESASVRRMMRADATLVVADGIGVSATGPFGEVRVDRAEEDEGVRCTAALCLALARPHRDAESDAGRWHRVLRAS